jgi:protease IV
MRLRSRIQQIVFIAMASVLVSACISPRIDIFPDRTKPLKEYTLEGKGKKKVLVVHVRGFISDTPKSSILTSQPSMLQEIVSQLRLAEEDDNIQAVVLQINTPGGSTTASDILYEEILRLKEKSAKKIVAALMDVAASGGYYVALPADFILAHPTTVTGSVGVLFLKPKISGFMGKLGLDVEISKSGTHKDMGSPFRDATEEEDKIMQALIDELGGRFLHLVAKHRKINQAALAQISTGRVYLAREAQGAGLIDRVGYLQDAIAKAKDLAGLPEDAKVVVYRRTKYPDDNLYNTSLSGQPGGNFKVIDSGFLEYLSSLRTGFYYLWLPDDGAN